MEINIITALIAGGFALLSAALGWKLKTMQDKRGWTLSLAKEHRNEVRELYTEAFALFEQTIRQVTRRQGFTLGDDFARLNAKIHLMAPENIVAQYDQVAAMLSDWSSLYEQASPHRMRVGESTFEIIQAPDPAAKFKEPAQNAFDDLQQEIQKLVAMMRSELSGHGKAVEGNQKKQDAN